MYSKIINPDTGLKVNIGSRLGKTILRNYLSVLSGGAHPAPAPKPPAHPRPSTGAGIGEHHIAFVVKNLLSSYQDGTRDVEIDQIIAIIYDILRTFIDKEVRGSGGLTIWDVVFAGGWDHTQPDHWNGNHIKLPDVIYKCLVTLNVRWRGGEGGRPRAPNAKFLTLTERFCLMLYTTPAGDDGIKFYEIINKFSRLQLLAPADFGHYRIFIRDAVQKLSRLRSGVSVLFRGGSAARRAVWEGVQTPHAHNTVVFRSLITSFSSEPKSSRGFVTNGGIWYRINPATPSNLRWLSGEYSWFATAEAEAILFADASTFFVGRVSEERVEGRRRVLVVDLTELPGAPGRAADGALTDLSIGSLGG